PVCPWPRARRPQCSGRERENPSCLPPGLSESRPFTLTTFGPVRTGHFSHQSSSQQVSGRSHGFREISRLPGCATVSWGPYKTWESFVGGVVSANLLGTA